jgi:signal transduction histidine kinase
MGTGLGLAMVRQVVEAHRGEIVALSREGGGTEFQLRLPRLQNHPKETDRESDVEGARGIDKIL